MAVVAGCTGLGGGSTSSFETLVSDQPGDIADFETLELTLTELRPKPVNGEEQTVDIEDTTVDLTQLVGEGAESLGTTELETGDYEYLKVTVGAVPTATLSDGGEAEVTTPGDAPLKFNAGFPVCADGETTFTADFTPVKQGQTNRYVLQPVADEVTVESTCSTATDTQG